MYCFKHYRLTVLDITDGYLETGQITKKVPKFLVRFLFWGKNFIRIILQNFLEHFEALMISYQNIIKPCKNIENANRSLHPKACSSENFQIQISQNGRRQYLFPEQSAWNFIVSIFAFQSFRKKSVSPLVNNEARFSHTLTLKLHAKFCAFDDFCKEVRLIISIA